MTSLPNQRRPQFPLMSLRKRLGKGFPTGGKGTLSLERVGHFFGLMMELNGRAVRSPKKASFATVTALGRGLSPGRRYLAQSLLKSLKPKRWGISSITIGLMASLISSSCMGRLR